MEKPRLRDLLIRGFSGSIEGDRHHHLRNVLRFDINPRRLRSAPFYAIQPNSRALSFAAFRARARNSARVIGPFC
jgi:hypothetical protein